MNVLVHLQIVFKADFEIHFDFDNLFHSIRTSKFGTALSLILQKFLFTKLVRTESYFADWLSF